MNKLFLALSFFMGIVVLASNYLVQFPIKYYGLDEILTYGAFSYPVAFLITDLANRRYGKLIAKKIVYFGFFWGVFLTFYFSTNFSDLISIRIAIGSGTAFITAQLIDVPPGPIAGEDSMYLIAVNSHFWVPSGLIA